MYAPIYLPQAPAPSPDVLTAERAILDAEGPRHVDGSYYADERDAAQQRRWAAERMVREAARVAAYADRAAGLSGRNHDRRPHVSTWLTSREQRQVDIAAGANLVPLHRSTLPAVHDDLATGRAAAALISVAVIRPADAPHLGTLVHGFSGHPVVGFVCDADDSRAIAGTLALGRAGAATVIDARTPKGWGLLRGAFDAVSGPNLFASDAVAVVLDALRMTAGEGSAAPTVTDGSLTDGCVRFFRAVFSPRMARARDLAACLGVCPSTLMSRFFRTGLPSPKQYIAWARLAWAARLAESPALSIAAVADRLDMSSAQSFGRTVRQMTGLTAVGFRRAFTGRTLLDHYVATLVTPYRDTLRTFDPVARGAWERPRQERATAAGVRPAGRLPGRAA